MGKIRWTNKAAAHLHAIHEYISKDSPTYATRFIKTLIRATQKLKTMPHCGRVVKELELLKVREVVFKSYRIVYRVSDPGDEVQILAVIHSARKFENVVDEDWFLG